MKNFKAKPPVEEKSKAGRLGGPLAQYMATNLTTFTPDTPIMEAVETLVKKGYSGAPVLNNKREVVGVIDEKDCLRVLFESAYHNRPGQGKTVESYMDKVMRTIPVDSDIIDAATLFLESSYKRLLVVDQDGKLVGQISRSDALRATRDLKKA